MIFGEARAFPIRRLVCNFEQGATRKLRIRETEGGEERRRKIDEIDRGVADTADWYVRPSDDEGYLSALAVEV
jgi:hypothetical protein